MSEGVARFLLISAIGIYQRVISPHKGFCCAYRTITGRASCSTLGLRAVRRHGAQAGLAIIRERLHRCGTVHRDHHASPRGARRFVLQGQRGECDLGCDADTLRCVDYGCLGCDWPWLSASRRRRNRRFGT